MKHEYKQVVMLEETTPYIHQVAGISTKGEKNEFLSYGGGKLLKKLKSDRRGVTESNYYKMISSASADTTDNLLYGFSAKYYQTVYCQESNNYYLCLEDLSSEFFNPSLIDIKIGHITWESEIVKQTKILKFPFSADIKFRICGMRISQSSGSYSIYEKEYGLQLTPETTLNAFQLFFKNGNVVGKIISKLKDLLSIFEKQKNWTFIATSILIIYENDLYKSTKNRFQVKMIDFAHAFPADKLDINYIEGLSSLIDYIEKVAS